MVPAAERAESLWARLRGHAERNAPRFAAAGIGAGAIREVECRVCGSSENALFWESRGERRGVLRLGCPFCGRYEVRYLLAENRVCRPPDPRRRLLAGAALSLALGLLLALYYFRDTPPLLALREDAAQLRAATAQRAQRLSAGSSEPAPPLIRPTRLPEASAPRLPVTVPAPAGPPPPRSGSPAAAPRAAAGVAEGARSVPPVPPALVEYAARGDRRAEVAAQAAAIAARAGPAAAAALRRVEYSAEHDETRIAVEAASDEWRGYLSGGGWTPRPAGGS